MMFKEITLLSSFLVGIIAQEVVMPGSDTNAPLPPDEAIDNNNFGGMPDSFSQYFTDVGNAIFTSILGFILLFFIGLLLVKVEEALIQYNLLSARCYQSSQIIEDSNEFRPEYEDFVN